MQQVSERREDTEKMDSQISFKYKVKVRSNHPKYENQLLKSSIF